MTTLTLVMVLLANLPTAGDSAILRQMMFAAAEEGNDHSSNYQNYQTVCQPNGICLQLHTPWSHCVLRGHIVCEGINYDRGYRNRGD